MAPRPLLATLAGNAVRMAAHATDVQAAQALRFEVFNLELDEGLTHSYDSGLDADAFDEVCDHLLVLDRRRGSGPEGIVGTYRLIRREAAGGRTFLWYTTETEELDNCDHVYVFRNGRIVAALDNHELSEEKVIQSSFAEATA